MSSDNCLVKDQKPGTKEGIDGLAFDKKITCDNLIVFYF